MCVQCAPVSKKAVFAIVSTFEYQFKKESFLALFAFCVQHFPLHAIVLPIKRAHEFVDMLQRIFGMVNSRNVANDNV